MLHSQEPEVSKVEAARNALSSMSIARHSLLSQVRLTSWIGAILDKTADFVVITMCTSRITRSRLEMYTNVHI